MATDYRRPSPLLAFAAACMLIPQAEALADVQKARMFAITTWDAGCSGGTRSSWDDMALAWYGGITGFWVIPGWAWTPAGGEINGNIVDSYLADCATNAWGNDCNKSDNVEALLVALHGGNNSTDHRWYGKVRKDESGVGNCYAYQGNMVFGDQKLEFLTLSSCFSMDREDWWSEWNSSFDGLHQIDGFHGVMWIYDWMPEHYGDFAFDSFFMPIADAFLDNLYIPDVSESFDQCPVARNVGRDSAESLARMSHERYNFVFSDPPGIGTSRSHRARYIVGCAPQGREALP